MMILERKLFAKRDYKGLDDLSASELKQKRSEIAKKLLKSRSDIKRSYDNWISEAEKIADGETRNYIIGNKDKGRKTLTPDEIQSALEERKHRASETVKRRYEEALSNSKKDSSSFEKYIKSRGKRTNIPKESNINPTNIKSNNKSLAKKFLNKKVLIPATVGAGLVGTGLAVNKYRKNKKFNTAKNKVLNKK